jgi:hypothetical protein
MPLDVDGFALGDPERVRKMLHKKSSNRLFPLFSLAQRMLKG